MDVSFLHLRYLNPFPKNLESLLSGFEKILVPEINRGQLSRILRERFLLPVEGFNRVQGVPLMVAELKEKITQMCKS